MPFRSPQPSFGGQRTRVSYETTNWRKNGGPKKGQFTWADNHWCCDLNLGFLIRLHSSAPQRRWRGSSSNCHFYPWRKLTAWPIGLRFGGNARGKSRLELRRRVIVQCHRDTCKAETSTILEPPNRTIRNSVSAFKNVGPSGTLLWKVLGRRAGEFREKEVHGSAGRLPYKIHGAPASSRASRARVHQFKGVVPPEYSSCYYVSPAGPVVDRLAPRSQAPSGQTCYGLWLARRSQCVAPAASR